MKLKIVNPVPGIDFVEPQYRAYLATLLPPDVELGFECITEGYPSIEAYTHTAFNSPEMIRLCAKAEQEGYQGIFLNCFADPSIMACREFLRIPVYGGYVPAMLTALALAERVGMITLSRATMISEEQRARTMGISARLAAMKRVDLGVLDLRGDPNALLNTLADACIDMHGNQRCDAVILGCTGMQFIVADLRARLKELGCPVQVVEPFGAGVALLEYTVRMGFTNGTNSVARFIPPEEVVRA